MTQLNHRLVKEFLALTAFACVIVSYVAGVLLWIYFFDEPGPEQGYETIMTATVISPTAFVFGLVYGIWVYRQPRLFWIILAVAVALLISASLATWITRQNNQERQMPVDQLVVVGDAHNMQL